MAGGYTERQAYSLKVERHTLSLPKWDADGFKVALLADLHMNFSEPTLRAKEAALMALEEKPDAILVLGDYLNHTYVDAYYNIERALEVLNEAKCPCYAILGNHDFTVDTGKVIEELAKTPLKLLRNEVADVDGVTIFGIDDALFGNCRPRQIDDYPTGQSVIAMLHEPDYVRVTPSVCSLQVSGHSHGGQMCLPFGRPVSLPRGARKYYKGFYPDAPVPLYVSRGVGTIGIDLRAFCPPEVSVLTLKSA